MPSSKLPVSLTSPDLEAPEVFDALDDYILFTDFDGLVVGGNSKALSNMGEMLGKPFWDLFQLPGIADFDQALAKFPLDTTHEVHSTQEEGTYSLRIVSLPLGIAPHGGYVIIATDVQPIVAMQEHYEEQLEDQHSGWGDTLTLFNALFDGVRDAILLVDESFHIIVANKYAVRLFGTLKSGEKRDCRTVIAPKDRGEFDEALRTLSNGAAWTASLSGLGARGERIPVSLTMRRVHLETYSLFQISMRDLSIRVHLEENLQQKEAEVEDMNITLKQVIRTVEEEKQEMKEELAQQVMGQMLPALERIAEEDCQDTRQNYKSVIEEQMVDFVDGTSDALDAVILKLTPREIEICRLIQAGRKGKEISEMLSVSFETLQTHRKNIRRKLNIKGRGVSLYAFLQQSDLS